MTKDSDAKKLYTQCCDAYHKWLLRQEINDHSGGLLSPGHFYDAYNVPAELLFMKLNSSTQEFPERAYAEFDGNLLEMVNKKAPYDREKLKIMFSESRGKKIKVYFQIYLPNSNKIDLFKTQITLCGIKFTWCNSQSFRRIETKADDTQSYSYYRNKIFPKPDNEFNIHAVKASLNDSSIESATSKVSKAFHDFMSCINVVQAFDRQSFKLSHNPDEIKTVVCNTGVFIAENDDEVQILWSRLRRHVLPQKELEELNENKKKLLRILVRAFQDKERAVAKRIKCAVAEFASAIDTDDPNLRLLGFWRCLEITTRRANKQTRKEEEILNIFQNYYPKKYKHWAQQGSLIMYRRNTYVHQGVSSVDTSSRDYHLNWAQQYAEAAIRILVWLYTNHATWKSDDDIDVFFDYYGKSDHSLELAGKMLRDRMRELHADR